MVGCLEIPFRPQPHLSTSRFCVGMRETGVEPGFKRKPRNLRGCPNGRMQAAGPGPSLARVSPGAVHSQSTVKKNIFNPPRHILTSMPLPRVQKMLDMTTPHGHKTATKELRRGKGWC